MREKGNKMASSLFDTLPETVIRYIFLYLPDHGSLCTMELICSSFRAISLAEPPVCWEALQRRRWTLPGSFGYSKNAYRRRHVMESEVTSLIRTLARTREEDELTRGFDIILNHTDVMESVFHVFQQSNDDRDLRNISKILVHLLHCTRAFQSLVGLKLHLEDKDDGERMEDSIIAMNCMFFDFDGPTNTCSPWIRDRLDEIAQEIRSRFHHGDEMPPEGKLEILNQVFFQEQKFAVNMEDESLHLWLPHAALQNSVARSLILAILYKSIARRIGLFIDIVGTGAEQIAALVPALEVFVDFARHDEEHTLADDSPIKYSLGMKEIKPLSSDILLSWTLYEVAKSLRQTSASDARGYLTWIVASSMYAFWDGHENPEETQSSLCNTFIVAYLNGFDLEER